MQYIQKYSKTIVSFITHLLNWSLETFSQDYELRSFSHHPICMYYLYPRVVRSTTQFLRKFYFYLFIYFFLLFTLTFFARRLLRRRNISFIFYFVRDDKPMHYLVNYGNRNLKLENFKTNILSLRKLNHVTKV